MKILVTGSSGLIDSAAFENLNLDGPIFWGVENNLRRKMFVPQSNTGRGQDGIQQFTRCLTSHRFSLNDRCGFRSQHPEWRMTWSLEAIIQKVGVAA